MIKKKYYIAEAENNMGRCLVLTAPWQDSFLKVIKKENIDVLLLSESMGFIGDNICFLKEMPQLRGVEIYVDNIKDITPLQHLTKLEYLGLGCEFTNAPDFAAFENLKICKLTWRNKAKSILNCKHLRLLNIENYPLETLEDLGEMSHLKRLQITSRKLLSVSGIQGLQSLQTLDFAYCPKLVSLSGVEECQQLDTVEIEVCKRIHDISPLGGVNKLKRLQVIDCGKIESLRFIENNSMLSYLNFAGSTAIEDGEFGGLLTLPLLKEMWFADRRHYSHKRDDIHKLLASK
jgi:Leucine-rich repeat (LRR) protein